MKNQDINQLLHGLLGEQPAAKPAKKTTPPPAPQPEQPKRPAASENARRRVEEILRNVELENSQRKMAETPKRQEMTIPKREPVPVPPPISHFTDEPSQNPAVRMRDRLDETALPMLDAERKPNQIIPPKPKPEQKKTKRKKRPPQPQEVSAAPAPAASAEIPVPGQEQPKRKIMHINVPDELPPDIPREVEETPAPQPPKRKIMHINVPDELPPDIPRKVEEIPAPQPPKRKIMHINVPDELPPDIPREVEETPAPQPPKRKIMHINVPDELPPDIPRDTTLADQKRRDAETPQTETAAQEKTSVLSGTEEVTDRETAFLKKAESIKQQIRIAMEEIQAVPDVENPDDYSDGEPLPDELPETSEEETESVPEEESSPAEEPEKRSFGGFFRRKQEERPEEDTAEIPEETETATAQEMSAQTDAPVDVNEPSESETPAVPRLRHLSVPDEPKERGGLLGRFSRKKKQNLTAEPASGEIDLTENIEVPVETVPEPSPARQGLFHRREKALLIPEPVEYDEMGEEADEEVYELPKTQPEPVRIPETSAVPVPEVPEEKTIHVALPEDEKAEKPHGFASAIRAALDQSAQELADVKAEPLPSESEQEASSGTRRILRRRTYFTVGILCSVFALAGIAACTVLAVKAVRSFAGSSGLKNELEDVLYPVAVVDLPEFETPSDAAPETLMSAAIIDLLMYGDLSQYPEVFDMISIPAEDVHGCAERMFGIEITEDPETLIAAGELFFFDQTTGCYNVPAAPVIFSYAPDIQEIRRSEDTYTVTVAYRADTAQWHERSENFSWSGEKTMEITLHKIDGEYQITRIMNVSGHFDGV